MKRWTALAVAGCVVAGVAACSSDSLEPMLDRGGSTTHGVTSGSDTSAHTPGSGTDTSYIGPTTPASNGPVVTDTVPPPTVAAPVPSFELHVMTKGLDGADTTKSELVAGATVTLLRTGGVNGDTLSTPAPAGTAVSGANGEVAFSQLAGGSYIIHVEPPAGSPYRAAERAIAPPRYSSIYISVLMQPR